jgi:hypothetical protein
MNKRKQLIVSFLVITGLVILGFWFLDSSRDGYSGTMYCDGLMHGEMKFRYAGEDEINLVSGSLPMSATCTYVAFRPSWPFFDIGKISRWAYNQLLVISFHGGENFSYACSPTWECYSSPLY